MSNKLTIINLILFLTLSACRTHSNNPVKEIDISQSYLADKEVLLSDIATDIKYVKLLTDSDCMIDNLNHPERNIRFSEDRIFISDNESLFVFDYSGNFLTRIGSKGRGPGEFDRIVAFTILPEDSLVVICPPPQENVLIYNFNNKYIKSLDIDFWPTSLSSLNNEFMVFGNSKGARNLTDYYSLSVLNMKGETVSRLIRNSNEEQVEKKEKLALSSISQFYHYFDTLTYWDFQYDTIWRIDNPDLAVPAYYINSGPGKLPFELLKGSADRDDWDGYVKIWNILETKRFIFLKVGYGVHLKHILYDKISQQSFNVKDTDDSSFFPVFINDIDGGSSFWPLGNVSGNKVFTLLNGYELKEKLKVKAVENESPLFEKRRKDLSELIENSEEIDNPVIMIVTIKD